MGHDAQMALCSAVPGGRSRPPSQGRTTDIAPKKEHNAVDCRRTGSGVRADRSGTRGVPTRGSARRELGDGDQGRVRHVLGRNVTGLHRPGGPGRGRRRPKPPFGAPDTRPKHRGTTPRQRPVTGARSPRGSASPSTRRRRGGSRRRCDRVVRSGRVRTRSRVAPEDRRGSRPRRASPHRCSGHTAATSAGSAARPPPSARPAPTPRHSNAKARRSRANSSSPSSVPDRPTR